MCGIDLFGNGRYRADGVHTLLEAVNRNQALTVIDIAHNCLGDDLQSAFRLLVEGSEGGFTVRGLDEVEEVEEAEGEEEELEEANELTPAQAPRILKHLGDAQQSPRAKRWGSPREQTRRAHGGTINGRLPVLSSSTRRALRLGRK